MATDRPRSIFDRRLGRRGLWRSALPRLLVAAFLAGGNIGESNSEPKKTADFSLARKILDLALVNANALEDAADRADLLRAIAVAEAKAGDVPGALKITSIIQNNSEKGWAWLEIAPVQAQSGDEPGAVSTFGQAFRIRG